MGSNFSTGNTSITGNVDVTLGSGTVSSVSGSGNNTTVTLGTVGAGKVWKILNANIHAHFNNTSQSTLLNFNAVTHLRLDGWDETGHPSQTTGTTWNYGTTPVLTAGQTIQLVTGNQLASASVQYIEETP